MIATQEKAGKLTTSDRLDLLRAWLQEHPGLEAERISLTDDEAKIEFKRESYPAFREVFSGRKATRFRLTASSAYVRVSEGDTHFDCWEPDQSKQEDVTL